MELGELRQKFIEYFQRAGYQTLPASSLVPENDPSVLFTTAGMQQFKPYYSHPETAPAAAVINVQPVMRTSDIGEVGDDTHLTMFEMLGNFRFGLNNSRQMKTEAIQEAWVFLTKELGIEAKRLAFNIFAGDSNLPADTESEGAVQALGAKYRQSGREDTFWGPTGSEGPCGPAPEVYLDGVEIGTIVFNQYYCSAEGQFTPLPKVGLDVGYGLERFAATLQGKGSVWEIEPFRTWVAYTDSTKPKESRIIIDHLRAIVFLVSAGITPGNKGREYILRRLIRKTVFLVSNLTRGFDWQVAVHHIRDFYDQTYELKNDDEILAVITKEKEQFEKNLNRAKSYLEKWLAANPRADEKKITELAFYMFESFGFPKEMVVEHLTALGWQINANHFDDLFKQHQEISRAGLDKQFKGGLADTEPQTIKHHTAHHLLLAALRQVLGDSVVQRGSNVTQERLRLDFSFDRKLTEQELKEVESIVNEKIQADLSVVSEEMDREAAMQSGALAEFGQKYGDKVTVYAIGDFSKELCGGPHIERTGLLGRFEIIKEEASSQGVRRIKARVS